MQYVPVPSRLLPFHHIDIDASQSYNRRNPDPDHEVSYSSLEQMVADFLVIGLSPCGDAVCAASAFKLSLKGGRDC